jgi:signal transduction histidine kinase
MQRQAGSEMGRTLAVPQLAALVKQAASLGTPVSRPILAATRDRDLELLVRATPDQDGVEIVIESWVERAPAAPRLIAMLGNKADAAVIEDASWSVSASLELVSVSKELAEHLKMAQEELVGQPLTRILRLEENDDGEMPLLLALGTRTAFENQHATGRRPGAPRLILSGDVTLGPAGEFSGLSGSAELYSADQSPSASIDIDHLLDEALRSPLDRIIEQAEQIVEQSDGPIQPDYAEYGNDIATAARHLLSVIGSMSEQPAEVEGVVNLAELAEEAVVMLETVAEDRQIAVQLQARRRLPARADRRAIIQILVNLIGNAIRHSPEGGHVDLYFTRRDGEVCVSVEDEGPGISPGDEERIFERFERASDDSSGTGLGLAIARRLARSMGGDVRLDSKPTRGARFSLVLPEA